MENFISTNKESYYQAHYLLIDAKLLLHSNFAPFNQESITSSPHYFSDYITAESQKKLLSHFQTATDENSEIHLELDLLLAEGIRPFHANILPLLLKDKTLFLLQLTPLDKITTIYNQNLDSKIIQAVHHLFPHLLLIIDNKGICLSLLGDSNLIPFSSPNIIGNHFHSFLPQAFDKIVQKIHTKLTLQPEVYNSQLLIPTNSDDLYFIVKAMPLEDNKQIYFFTEMTKIDHQNEKDTLSISSSFVTHNPSIFYTQSTLKHWRFEYISPNCATLLGYSSDEIMKQFSYLQDLVHPDDRELIKQRLLYPKTTQICQQYRILTKDASYKWIKDEMRYICDDNQNPILIHGFWTDISEYKELEEKKTELENSLRHAQKLESIGVLASGIAHDFNNILSAILSHTEISLLKLDSGANPIQIQNALSEIKNATVRARDLVQQILIFSRQHKEDTKSLQISSIVKEVNKLLKHTISADIQLNTNICSQDYVLANPTNIHQIIMNLCTNAAQAMENKGGILKIELHTVSFCDLPQQLQKRLDARNYVKLSVKDSGIGISAENIQKIFEPYFTTKDTGQGTGLGLSITRSIVERCNGGIHVESILNKGSEFMIFLPVHEKVASVCEVTEEEVKKNYSGNILLVDDEESIISSYDYTLSRIGFSVISSTHSLEAYETFKRNPDMFDLVMADYAMPFMNGLDLIRSIKAIRPEIPVILFTGYTNVIDTVSMEMEGVNQILLKPIALKDMIKTIESSLAKNEELS